MLTSHPGDLAYLASTRVRSFRSHTFCLTCSASHPSTSRSHPTLTVSSYSTVAAIQATCSSGPLAHLLPCLVSSGILSAEYWRRLSASSYRVEMNRNQTDKKQIKKERNNGPATHCLFFLNLRLRQRPVELIVPRPVGFQRRLLGPVVPLQLHQLALLTC